jgi:anti-sigma-K factor RskA
VIPVSDHETDLGADDELDELAALRSLARGAGIDADRRLEPLETPPADLWRRIEAETGTNAKVIPLTARTPSRRTLFVAAAAAAAVVAVAVTTLSLGDDGEPEVLASTTLERLGPAGSGSVELLDDGGHLRLRVDTADLDAGDGFLELWVIDTEVQRLVSLGPLRDDGLYDLPDGLDPAAFPIVDVSVEPIDGDPTHSGASVLRGQLEV